MTSYGWIIPQQADDAASMRYVENGAFRLQRCATCVRFRHPARWICPHCGSTQYDWAEPAGTGTVTSVAWFFQNLLPPPRSARDEAVALPYNAVVVQLDEGPFMLGRVEGAKFGSLAVGDRVVARIGKALVSDAARIVFIKSES